MIMSAKVYIVIEYGGEYEDSWEHIIGVCSTPELADELKTETENSHNKSCNITEDEWFNINEAVSNWEDDHEVFDDLVSGIKFLFPCRYSDKDIQDAIDKYDNYDDYCGVYIKEANYYTNINEL